MHRPGWGDALADAGEGAKCRPLGMMRFRSCSPAPPPAAAAGSVRLPGGAELREVDFERHVVSLLGKAGCNTGACHGAFQGKGGFRLSLFGHAPEKDFRALPRDDVARRVNRYDPDRSVLLLKATGQ